MRLSLPPTNLRSLRAEFPEEGWHAIKCGFSWRYENNNGDKAWRVSVLSPRFDGDDETCFTRLEISRKKVKLI
jgi:hypothetical protein